MSRGWKETGLTIGEDLILPDELFESPDEAKRRILYCIYAGETDTGIIVEIQYQPGICSEAPLESWRVQKFIDFAAMYCGQVVVKRKKDRTVIMPERKRELVPQMTKMR